MQLLVGIALVLVIMGFLVVLFFQHPQFGKLPKGEHLEGLKRSANYKKGKFWNQVATPNLAKNTNYWKVLAKLVFQRSPGKRPSTALPTLKTNLKELAPQENILVWFGHSSYFLQIEGLKILIDPVFSSSASPLPFATRCFKGTNMYSADDFPVIDFLLITHDHWDYLDYKSVMSLRSKVSKVIGGLGTMAHFRAWGYAPDKLKEMDWYEQLELKAGISLHGLPARHFSGRTLRRNPTLWLSFFISTSKRKLYLGGDSGYGPHFKAIGNRFGPFDLVVLESGQYNPDWKYIHLLPEQFFPAANDLRARNVLPVHHSKFSLARHSWDAPLKAISILRQARDPKLLTPHIGEKLNLDLPQKHNPWWEKVQ